MSELSEACNSRELEHSTLWITGETCGAGLGRSMTALTLGLNRCRAALGTGEPVVGVLRLLAMPSALLHSRLRWRCLVPVFGALFDGSNFAGVKAMAYDFCGSLEMRE